VNASVANLNTETSNAINGRMARNIGNGALLGGQSPARRNFQPGAPAPAQVVMAQAASESATQAQELGDLFEYKLKEPISIQKNRSALVPIVQSTIDAEKVSVWNERAGLPRPQRAL
jgi:hypothetical protein